MESKNYSRIKTAKLNSTVTCICQIIQIFLNFFTRKIFIYTLGVVYLGYNSVFSNILQLLSLADLGVETAITGFLYKPLAENDMEKISILMIIFKKVYHIIGFIVLILGFITSCFLKSLLPDASCSIWYLRILFYINLSGIVSTYLLAYKRTLLIADQKTFLVKLTDTSIYSFISIVQIIMLFIVPNYIIYLTFNIFKNILSNLILSVKADRLYGNIETVFDKKILHEYTSKLTGYVQDVFISRIGATIYYGTDNIILSIFHGSLITGYLSNYTMITAQLSNIILQMLSSLQASFGNYVNSGSSMYEQQKMTDNYFCANFFIGNFCMICFALLAQPFIELFFGRALLLNFSTVLWLSINLLLTVMIQLPGQLFAIYRLFHYDRPIIVFSATLNIFISVRLVYILGINGVLIGTFCTSLIYLFSRIYIISKYVYHISLSYYIRKIFFYFIISIITFFMTLFLTYGFSGKTLFSFVLRSVLVGLCAVLFPAALLSFTNEFRFLLYRLIPKRVKHFYNTKNSDKGDSNEQ